MRRDPSITQNNSEKHGAALKNKKNRCAIDKYSKWPKNPMYDYNVFYLEASSSGGGGGNTAAASAAATAAAAAARRRRRRQRTSEKTTGATAAAAAADERAQRR